MDKKELEKSVVTHSSSRLCKTTVNQLLNTPNLLESLDWGFTYHKCSNKALKGRYEVMRPKIDYLIDMGVLDVHKNGIHLINRHKKDELVDELIITDASTGECLGGLIVNMRMPVKEYGKHCKDRLGNPLYEPQTVLWTKRYKYKFGLWSNFKDALRFDEDLRVELKYAFSNSNLVRFRNPNNDVDIDTIHSYHET